MNILLEMGLVFKSFKVLKVAFACVLVLNFPLYRVWADGDSSVTGKTFEGTIEGTGGRILRDSFSCEKWSTFYLMKDNLYNSQYVRQNIKHTSQVVPKIWHSLRWDDCCCIWHILVVDCSRHVCDRWHCLHWSG